MNNNQNPFKTTGRERQLNVENGLQPRMVILVIVVALVLACGIGVYFGLFIGRQIFGG